MPRSPERTVHEPVASHLTGGTRPGCAGDRASTTHADRAHAAAHGLRASLWRPAANSITVEFGMAAAPAARRARDAVRNDPYAARIVELWAGNVAPTGINEPLARPHAET